MSIIRNRSRLGKSLLVVVGATALLGVAGFAAYRYFFNRAGEAAIALIPADVAMVVTVDTTPSERQLTTFKKIGDTLQSEGLLQKLDETLDSMMNGAPVAKEIRPYVSHSYAMAMWMPEGETLEPRMAVLMATSSPDLVQASLQKHGKPAPLSGLKAFVLADGKIQASVIGEYLVLSPEGVLLERINETAKGRRPNLQSQAEYKVARESLPSDSNFMFFMGPAAIKGLQEQAGDTMGMGVYSSAKWISFGLTVRPDGLQMDYRCPYDTSKMPSLKAITTIKPLGNGFLRQLPTGAYGLFSYAEPAKYWGLIDDTLATEPMMKDNFVKGVAQFEKETGLRVKEDILPAFGGNLTVAFYPTPGNETGSADMVLVIDNANNANPVELGAKLRYLLEKKASEHGENVSFVVTEEDGAKIYRLDPASEKKLKEAIAGGGKEAVQSIANPGGDMDYSEGMPAPQPKPRSGADFLQGKTFAYAEKDGVVVIASSDAMLNQALGALRGSVKTLADDPSFADMQGMVADGSQGVMMVDMRRIMEALRPLMEKALENGPVSMEDVVAVFGEPGTGAVASHRYEGDVLVGDMFLPLDYVRLIKIIGAGVRETSKPVPTFEKSENDGAFEEAPPVITR